jgi:hypothetical protein
VATVPLYKGGEAVAHAVVDEVDHLWACQFRWHITEAGYAARSQRRGPECKPYRMFLHREILGLKHGYKGVVVDHIDGDPLNNVRENLRAVTHAQNCQNRKLPADNKSGYRGVSWKADVGRWRVQVMVDGERTVVGYFDDVHEAGNAAQNFYAQNMPHARQSVVSSTATGPGLRDDEDLSAYSLQGPGGERAIPDSPTPP